MFNILIVHLLNGLLFISYEKLTVMTFSKISEGVQVGQVRRLGHIPGVQILYLLISLKVANPSHWHPL